MPLLSFKQGTYTCELPVRLQVAAGADPKAALAAAARSSSGSLLVFGTNNGFFEDQKAAGDGCAPCQPAGSVLGRQDCWFARRAGMLECCAQL